MFETIENNGPLEYKNEIPFELHYVEQARTEIHNYLKISPNKQIAVLAESETLQVYSISNGSGKHDQLVTKVPRKLGENVSNNFSYQFLEKK